MSALDPILQALGRGDRRQGVRAAASALLCSIPAWLALAAALAIGR